MITKKILKKTITYKEYRNLIDELIHQNKTTGNNQNEQFVGFTKLNVHRMNRLDKTAKINPEFTQVVNNLSLNQIWVVITEAWCGDSAQLIPYMEKMAESSDGKIELSILFRDENPQLMECFLTNSTRSIPKLLALDKQSLNPVFIWGPRPAAAQQIMLDYKANKDMMTWDEFELKLHQWYTVDGGKTTVKEISKILASELKVLTH